MISFDSTRRMRLLKIVALAATLITVCVRAETAGKDAINAFRADLAAKVKVADKNYDSVIQGKDGWMFFVPEVRSVSVGKFWGEEAKKVSRSVKLEYSDPLPAILDFKTQLDKAGIKLLLVPVPPKSVVFADKISSRALPAVAKMLPRMDSAYQEFYQLLRGNGVSVLDLTDEFLAQREMEILHSTTGKLIARDPIYCKQDSHWSPRACFIAASQIKKLIGSSFPIKRMQYSTKSVPLTFNGDLRDALPQGAPRPKLESLVATYVGTPDPRNKSTLLPVSTAKNSPVLLMGDSHTLVFHAGRDMHAKGAGLADHLAYQLGFPVDLIGVRGSGATPARVNLMRRARADANYLRGKKWVVWCFSAREFTESAGWQKVPIVK